jgi:hypothetical protein
MRGGGTSHGLCFALGRPSDFVQKINHVRFDPVNGGPSGLRTRAQEQESPEFLSLRRLAAVLAGPKMLAFLWIVAVLHLGFVFTQLPPHARGLDFSIYYVAADAAHRGINPYTADLIAIGDRLGVEVRPLPHIAETPFLLLCFQPLTLLGPVGAYWTWFGVNVAALVAVMILLLRSVGPGAGALGGLMLLYPPLVENFMWAQTQIVILLMLALMLYWLERGDDAPAGLILAAAGAMRAYPLAMVGYLALRQRWRALLFTVAGLAVIGVATLCFFGWNICFGFVRGALFAIEYQFAAVPKDISISGFVSRIFWYSMGPNLPLSIEVVRHCLIIAADLAIVTLTVRATLASIGARSFSLWIATAIMVSPLAWLHYLVLMFILFAQLAIAANRGECSNRAAWAIVASYLSVGALNKLMDLTPSNMMLFLWIGECYFIPLMLAYLSAYWLATDIAPSTLSDMETFTSSALETARA